MSTEHELVQLALSMSKVSSPGLNLANGDDAAIFSGLGTDWAISTDAFIEDVHFRRSYFPLFHAGAKAIEAAASDLIAVGAKPRFCLISQSLPHDFHKEDASELWSGIRSATERLEMNIIGGDTCRSPQGIQLHVTVLGSLEGHTALSRGAAQAGDLLILTGSLGASLRGFQIWEEGFNSGQGKAQHTAKEKFLHTKCRLDCLPILRDLARAAIDISDGLGKELSLLCTASNVGALLQSCHIPTFDFPDRPLSAFEVFSSGEEYEVLFTVPPSKLSLQPGQSAELQGVQVWCIGTCTTEKSIMVDAQPLQCAGFEHFCFSQ